MPRPPPPAPGIRLRAADSGRLPLTGSARQQPAEQTQGGGGLCYVVPLQGRRRRRGGSVEGVQISCVEVKKGVGQV